MRLRCRLGRHRWTASYNLFDLSVPTTLTCTRCTKTRTIPPRPQAVAAEGIRDLNRAAVAFERYVRDRRDEAL